MVKKSSIIQEVLKGAEPVFTKKDWDFMNDYFSGFYYHSSKVLINNEGYAIKTPYSLPIKTWVIMNYWGMRVNYEAPIDSIKKQDEVNAWIVKLNEKDDNLYLRLNSDKLGIDELRKVTGEGIREMSKCFRLVHEPGWGRDGEYKGVSYYIRLTRENYFDLKIRETPFSYKDVENSSSEFSPDRFIPNSKHEVIHGFVRDLILPELMCLLNPTNEYSSHDNYDLYGKREQEWQKKEMLHLAFSLCNEKKTESDLIIPKIEH